MGTTSQVMPACAVRGAGCGRVPGCGPDVNNHCCSRSGAPPPVEEAACGRRAAPLHGQGTHFGRDRGGTLHAAQRRQRGRGYVDSARSQAVLEPQQLLQPRAHHARTRSAAYWRARSRIRRCPDRPPADPASAAAAPTQWLPPPVRRVLPCCWRGRPRECFAGTSPRPMPARRTQPMPALAFVR